MSHKLHDITLYYDFDDGELNGQFTVRQNVVSDLYVYFLRGYKPPKTTRISITLKDQNEHNRDPFHSGSILNAEAFFDRETFWKKNAGEQKKIILDTIHSTALGCTAKFGWEKAVFHRAYEMVKQSDYVFKIESEGKWSPDRRVKAKIEIQKNEEKSIISANFYDEGHKLIRKIELFESFQSDLFYGWFVRKFKWFSNNEFGVYSKTGELRITGDVETGQSKTFIEPNRNSREIIEGQLRYTLYRDLRTNEDIAAWANR